MEQVGIVWEFGWRKETGVKFAQVGAILETWATEGTQLRGAWQGWGEDLKSKKGDPKTSSILTWLILYFLNFYLFMTV